MQSCRLIEPLKFANGAPPSVPIFADQRIPNLRKSVLLQDTDGGSDTKLRIFSGTANPALSQVANGWMKELLSWVHG